MEQAQEVIDYIKNKKMIDETKANIMSRFPFLGAYVNNLEIEASNCKTARTNGKKVKYNPKFMESLSEDERAFTLAHEIMHIAFDHIKRGKDGERDIDTWNIATDAVINQMLEHGGLPIKKGFVNMPEALNKSADEMYEIIKDRKQNNSPENGEGGDGLPPPPDNHDEWEPPEDENESNDHSEDEKDNNGGGDATPDENGVDDDNQKDGSANGKDDADKGGASDEKDDSDNGSSKNDDKKDGASQDYGEQEKAFNETNDQMKKNLARQVLEDFERAVGKLAGSGAGRQKVNYGDVGEAKNKVTDWKKILKKELETDETMWSYRRADADNYYQARIEALEQNNRPITQVLLDTSGSISTHLLKNFLRQLKPLLKESDLEVGCFDDEFYGFHKIKNISDINAFKVEGRGGTNFNLAVKSFSKDPKINKIVFTDGYDKMTIDDKKYDKIIWVVFDNPKFKIPHGKVVCVSSAQINQNLIDNSERTM